MERICRQCGAPFTQARRRGRPLVNCESCGRPPKSKAKAGYRSPSRKDVCAGCGAEVFRSYTSAVDIYCRDCRVAGNAPSKARHGTDRKYKQGCKCDVCINAQAQKAREYAARRRDAGNPIKPSRKMDTRNCKQCGTEFTCRASDPSLFCTLACVGLSRRIDIKRGSFYIPRARRLAIYERDGWNCQICGEATDPDADPVGGDWYPTLDHIIPQSHMLFPDHSDSNLRTAHRWCNTVRGDLSCHTDDDLRLVV